MPSFTHGKELFLKFVEETEASNKQRVFKGVWELLYKLIAVSYSLFLIYTAISAVIPSSFIRGLFILFITVMIFMRYPALKHSPMHRPSAIDFILIALAIPTFVNFCLQYAIKKCHFEKYDYHQLGTMVLHLYIPQNKHIQIHLIS